MFLVKFTKTILRKLTKTWTIFGTVCKKMWMSLNKLRVNAKIKHHQNFPVTGSRTDAGLICDWSSGDQSADEMNTCGSGRRI